MKSKVIAVTGCIGSGKSEVVQYLRKLGYATLDCDVLAREVSERAEVAQQVSKLLGAEFVRNGQLDRRAIRDKVFADEGLLKRYNAIFFGEVKSLLSQRIAELSSDKYIFVEISVFDAFEYAWDGVWLIDSSEVERKHRVILRDNTSQQSLDNILRSQRICTDYTLRIANDGSIDELKIKVENALKQI